MSTFTTAAAVRCPRCATTIAAGTTVRMVPTPSGNKPGCIDCTGERQPVVRTTRYERQENEEAAYERRVESAFLARQGIRD